MPLTFDEVIMPHAATAQPEPITITGLEDCIELHSCYGYWAWSSPLRDRLICVYIHKLEEYFDAFDFENFHTPGVVISPIAALNPRVKSEFKAIKLLIDDASSWSSVGARDTRLLKRLG